MKTLKICLIVILLSVTCFSCTAQTYRKLRFGVAIGRTQSSGISILSLEPSFRIKDNFSIGWRIEAMGEREIRECYSLTLNGQYYLKKRISLAKDFRVFVGLGAGDFFSRHDNPLITITLPNGQQVDGNVIETTQGKGGFYPRIGFEYHHFSVIIDYNFIYRKFLRFAYFDPLLNQSLPGVYLYRSDNYLSFKIGYYFGGGKKKR